MENSHAAGWGPDAPSPAQLKELFDQIQTGRITGPRLQRFLLRERPATIERHLYGDWGSEPPSFDLLRDLFSLIKAGWITGPRLQALLNHEWRATVKEARKIMRSGGEFFGEKEWQRVFDVELPAVPGIPWTARELLDERFKPQGQFLFLRPASLGGEPLSLQSWDKVRFKVRDIRTHMDSLLSQKFAQAVADQTRWILMPIGAICSSGNLAYDEQLGKLPSGYEVSSALDRVIANVLYYSIHPDIQHPRFLDDNRWARTSDKFDDGRSVDIWGQSFFGVSVCSYGDKHDRGFISASRKIGKSVFEF